MSTQYGMAIGIEIDDRFDGSGLTRGVDTLTGGHLDDSFYLPRGDFNFPRGTIQTLVLVFDYRLRDAIVTWLHLPFGAQVSGFYPTETNTAGVFRQLPSFSIADVLQPPDPYLRLLERIGHLARVQWLQESLEYVWDSLVAQPSEADAQAIVDELTHTLGQYRRIRWQERPNPFDNWVGDICPILEVHQEDEQIPNLVAALERFSRGQRQPTLYRRVIAGIVAEHNMHGALYAAEDLMAFAEWQPQGKEYVQRFINLAKQTGRSLQQGIQFQLRPQRGILSV